MIGEPPEIARIRMSGLLLRVFVCTLVVLLLAPATPAQVRIEPRPTPKPTPTPRSRPAASRPRVFMEFVEIPAGEFNMGSNEGEGNEQPIHAVRITTPFEMGKYEVTQRQWKDIMDDNPSYFPGDDRPVDNVSWDNAQEFIRRLNERDEEFVYRLPTEAEWEYACRAGTEGEVAAELPRIASYAATSGGRTSTVGSRRANAWGLYDLIGNVAEWVADWYEAAYYKKSPAEDPKGPASGVQRVLRGCGFNDEPEDCTASARKSLLPDKSGEYIGFRLVRVRKQ